MLRGDRARDRWRLDGPHYLGSIVHHFVFDPRDGRTMLMAASTGQLGPTIYRSTDVGKTWKEVEQPPAFPKALEGETGSAIDHTFWLVPSVPSEPGVWYAGTVPPGLFRSEDAGNLWQGVKGFNEHPMRESWGFPVPGGAILHSINVDPRDPAHIYIGLSSGGVFETLDTGATWAPMNRGCEANFLPDPDADYGHDPHCVQMHPLAPDRLYQQNHCGIYRMDRSEGRWVRIGNAMPKRVGDIGFPIVLHPRDPDTAWVFPMDGTEVWPRTNVGGSAAAYVTRNAGKSWTRRDAGLPQRNAWWNVKRQAMTADSHAPVGVYFGTTNGEVWASTNEGEGWRCLVRDLPEIYSVEVAELSR